MKFKCEINMDNAAFGENPAELQGILQSVSDRLLKTYGTPWGMLYEEGSSGKILDSNGNSVGQWEITE